MVFIGCSVLSTGSEPKEIKEPIGEKVAAYFYADPMSVADTKSALVDTGFEIVAEYGSSSFQKGCEKGTVIVATNRALKAEGAKLNRGFAIIIRLLVDNKRKRVSFINPLYFAKAFMQEEYNYALFQTVQNDLRKAFPSMRLSKDSFAYDEYVTL